MPPELNHFKKILVMKHRHLGDVLLSSPVFAVLKKAFPQAQIDAYLNEETLPMLEGHPAIHGFISYRRDQKSFWRKWRHEWELLQTIRNNSYDLMINLTEGDRGTLAAVVSQARVRVGFEPKGKWQKKVYTHTVKHGPGVRHTVEKNLDAVRKLGIFPAFEDRELFLHIPPLAKKAVQQNEPFILLHPTSRWFFKCWPIEQMRKLAQVLLQKGKKLLLSAGPAANELEMADQICKNLPIENWAGRLSLKELAALIDQAEMLICVDSVPFHMASALKKPVIALFGPTSEITWGPWRNPYARVVFQQRSCRPCYQDGCGGSKQSDCLQTLSVERVLLEIKQLTQKTRSQNSSFSLLH